MLLLAFLVEMSSKSRKNGLFSVALVDQQAEHIQCHTTLKVGKMHGSLNSDVWNKQSGFDEFMSVHNVSYFNLIFTIFFSVFRFFCTMFVYQP